MSTRGRHKQDKTVLTDAVKSKWDPEGSSGVSPNPLSLEHGMRRAAYAGWNSKSLCTLKSREIQFPWGTRGRRAVKKQETVRHREVGQEMSVAAYL